MVDTKRTLISVGGVDLPTPSSYDVNIATLVNGQRNANGVMIGEEIRGGVLRVDLMWRHLKPGQWRDILSLFTDKRVFTSDEEGNYRTDELGGNFINDVILYDPETGEYDNRRMYVSDRQSKMHMVDEDGRPNAWLECTLNLIEV